MLQPIVAPRTPSSSIVRAALLVRRFGLALALGPLLAACTPVALLVSATGMATDTSVTWEVVKHIHGQLTADDAAPCIQLNGVQRALNARCEYTPGNIRSADIARSGLQECPLAVATRDPRLWRALPELLDRGARVEACPGSPLLALAAADACPDFGAASPEVREAIRSLAEDDPRAVRHDVFRMLSCPRARAVGLDRVLMTWLDRGDLQPGRISFSPLGAADPELLMSRFGRELETAGHKPEAALDGYEGVLPSGYELALRSSHWADRLVALPPAAARQPGAAFARRPPLGAAAAGAGVGLPAACGDAARHGRLADGARRQPGAGAAVGSAPHRRLVRSAVEEPDAFAARAEDGTLRLGDCPGRLRRRRDAGRDRHVAALTSPQSLAKL